MSEMQEAVAAAIYERMPFAGVGVKPPWKLNGNSLKQDEARMYARAAIEEMTFASLGKAFGAAHPFSWPRPAAAAPGLFSRHAPDERRINAALATIGRPPIQGFRDRWHSELAAGQYTHEDAGGFLWRCWAAALDVPTR